MEVKYHVTCLNTYLRKYRKASADSSEQLIIKSAKQTDDRPFNNVLTKVNEGIAKGKAFTLSEIYSKYVQLNGLKSKRVFVEALRRNLGEQIEIVKSRRVNESSILLPKFGKTETLHEYIDNADDASGSQSILIGPSELAQMDKICSDIRVELDKIPDFVDFNDLTIECYKQYIPESLIWIIKCITGDSGELNSTMSICQDIIYSCFKGQKITPKHVGLGIMIHQETRSKKIIECLHSCGHSIPYKDVLRLRNTIAQKEVSRFVENDNSYIPTQLVEKRFVQFAGDNIDILEESLDKAPTFHGTQIVAFQAGPPHRQLSPLKLLPYKIKLTIPESFHTLHKSNYNKSKKSVPRLENKKSILTEAKQNSFIQAYNFAWILCRTAATDTHKGPSAVVVPQWSGFGKLLHHDDTHITTYAYLPLLPYVASEYDTVWTTMVRCDQIAKKLKYPYTVITFDQAIYFKAKEIQWLKSEECSHYVIRLGGFHIMLNFLKVIGQHMECSGLNHVWLESNLYGDATVSGIMEGKKWNKGIRAHKVTYESLMRIFTPMFEKWLIECKSDLIHTINMSRLKANEISKKIKKQKPLTDFFDIIKSCEELQNAFRDFIDSQSPTFQLWCSYLNMVETLLEFLYSERTGKWELHLQSFRKMLPMFFAYDHTHYARWGSVYLCDMKNLSLIAPAVHKEFLNGHFVVKKSKGGFNHISVDQALEHVNKTSKDAGGIIGLTKNSTRLDEWYLSFNEIGDMINTFRGSLKLDPDSSSQNIEIGKQRILIDEQTVLTLQEQFLKYGVFSTHTENVISIATNEIYSEELQTATLGAKLRGEAALESFIQSMDSTDFYKPLKKIRTAAYVKRKEQPSTNSDKLLGQQFLQKILAAKEMGRNINYEDIFRHELTHFPMSLTANGQLGTPSHKSALGNILEKYTQSCTMLPPEKENTKTCHIYDGMSIVQILGKPLNCKTFGEYAEIFSKIVFTNRFNAKRVDVVFDNYRENSIKNVTRMKRGQTVGIRRIIDNPNTTLPQQWHLFINSVFNKRQLTNFLSEQLITLSKTRQIQFATSGGFENVTDFKTNVELGDSCKFLTSDHEEADTRIILHVLSAKMAGYTRCIVECSDTDVLVLLVHFKKQLIPELWMKVGKGENLRYIPIHDINMSENLSNNLPAFHALTGCDTTSQFGGFGKKTCWKVYLAYSHYLNGVGMDDISEELFIRMYNFVLKIYSKNPNITSINTLRGVMAAATPINKLPPTEDALRQHCLRVCFQTKVWLQASVPLPKLPSTTEFGWYVSAKRELLPVFTTLPPFPTNLAVLTSCGCKKDCASKVCSCKKNKLCCIGSCKCMAQKTCKNPLTASQSILLPEQGDSECSDDE
ncbi:uncharacterized protein LOC116169072 [Photinus pyralis]|nr:uncharacterized protein LOC116169072 [Photinus pyralis]